MSSRHILGIFALCILSPFSLADEPVTIKLRRNQQGDKVRQTRVETDTNIAALLDGTGAKVAEQKTSKEVSSKFTEEIIAKEKGKRATKVKRTYESAQMKKDDQTVDVPLEGKTVIVERKGDKHSFQLAGGGTISQEAAAFLRDEFKDKREDDASDLEESFVPKSPVKAGDTWKCDLAKLIKTFSKEGMKIDAKKSSANAKLLRTYSKDGVPFGVLDVEMVFTITDFGKGGATEPKLAKDATMKIHMTMDVAIDGSTSSGKGTVTMDLRALMKVKQGDMDVDVDVVNKRTLIETNELLK